MGKEKTPIYSPAPLFAPWAGRPGFCHSGNYSGKPASISSLPTLVNRDFKTVCQDVPLLVAAGIVELRETRGKRLQPRSVADTLILEVA